MKQIEFSQDELKVIMSVLNSITLKLGDAKVLLPIAEKILANIDPEPTVVDKVEPLKVDDLKN